MAIRPYTDIQTERVGDRYRERNTIHTGSAINGNVHFNGLQCDEEAVVVDYDRFSDEVSYGLSDIYQDAVQRYRDEFGDFDADTVKDHELAKCVYESVTENMAYDREYTDRIASKHDGETLSLQEFYVDVGRGVCRHMALATAAVLERMHEAGVLEGTGIINRNLDPDHDGHMWAEYVESTGRRLVLDPAQGTAGGPNPDTGTWDYHPDMRVDDLNPELLE